MIWDDSGAFQADPDEKRLTTVDVAEVSSTINSDLESGFEGQARPPMLWQPISVALSLMLVIAALGSGWRSIAIEIAHDHKWIRLAFVAAMPAQIWLSLVRSKR